MAGRKESDTGEEVCGRVGAHPLTSAPSANMNTPSPPKATCYLLPLRHGSKLNPYYELKQQSLIPKTSAIGISSKKETEARNGEGKLYSESCVS